MAMKKSTDSHESEDQNHIARLLESEVATQTIDLSSLLTRDVTSSGSFDISGQIWSTTFGKLLQALPIPALLIDESYAIVVANQGCARVTSTYEKLQGHAFPSLFPEGPTLASIKRLLEAIFLQRRTKVTETPMQIQNKTKWVRITLRPIRIMDRRFILAILEDLTPEKSKIALQVKHKDELQKAHDKLEASLREKEILLKEIYHRVGNNLQFVSSLLGLHLRQTTLKDESIGEILEDIQRRIEAMAQVHDAMYVSESLELVDFSLYLLRIVDSLRVSSTLGRQELSIRTDLNSITFDINSALACGLIVNELVVNALKHAFPADREGEVVVSLESISQGEFQLAVRDNGVGMPQHIDLMNPESVGLQLVMGLARQLKGTVEFTREKGTEVRVRFRIETSAKQVRF